VVVISGVLEVVRSTGAGEELIVVYGAGNFLGDVTMLSSRRSLMRARMRDAGENHRNRSD